MEFHCCWWSTDVQSGTCSGLSLLIFAKHRHGICPRADGNGDISGAGVGGAEDDGNGDIGLPPHGRLAGTSSDPARHPPHIAHATTHIAHCTQHSARQNTHCILHST